MKEAKAIAENLPVMHESEANGIEEGQVWVVDEIDGSAIHVYLESN